MTKRILLTVLVFLAIAASAAPAHAQFMPAGGWNQTIYNPPFTVQGHPLPLLRLRPDASATSGTVQIVQWPSATTLAGTTTLLALDGSSNIAHGSQAIIGINLDLAASDQAGTMALDIDSAQTAGTGIDLNMTGSGAHVGQKITMAAGATGQGLLISHGGTAAGASSIALRLAGADESVALEMADGDTVGVSAASEGRLVYHATNQAWMTSANAGAYAYLVTSASGAALTLQNAYGGGDTITVTADNPAEVANAAGVVSDLLKLTDATTSATSKYGLVYSRTGTPAGHFTGGAISITSTPGNAAFNEAGTLLSITQSSGALATDTTKGIVVSLTPGASAAVVGQSTTIGANTSTSGYAAVFDSRGTAGTGTTTNGIVKVLSGASTTLTGGVTGIVSDLTNFAGNQRQCGLLVVTAATTAADSATTAAADGTLTTMGTGALQVFSRATASRVVDVVCQNTSGTLASVRYPSGVPAVAVSSTITGLSIDLSSNIDLLASTIGATGLKIAIGDTDVAAANGVAALAINSDARIQRVLDIDVANRSGSIAVVRYGAATTLDGALTVLSLNAASSVVPGTNAVTGVDLTIPSNAGSNASQGYKVTRSGAATATGTFTGNLVNLQNTPTGGAGGVTLTENGVLVNVNHAPIAGATAITDTTTAIRATLTPSTTNSTGLRALDLLFGANVTGGTLANMSWNGASTLTAAMTLLNLDASTNLTPSTFETHGAAITLGASSHASTTGLTITSTQTGAASSGISVAMTGVGTTVGQTISMAPGSSAATNGLNINMGANSTGIGLRISGPSAAIVTANYGRLGQLFEINTTANFGGIALNTWTATAGECPVIDFDRSKSATIGTQSALTTNDYIGGFNFRGSTGAAFNDAANIVCVADGAFGVGDAPGRLMLQTTPDGTATAIERLRINNAGVLSTNGAAAVTGVSPGMMELGPPQGTANYAGFACVAYGTGKFALLDGFMARGTSGSPTATQSGDQLFRFGGGGLDSSSGWHGGVCAFNAFAAENYTSGALGTYMTFVTTPVASVTALERLRLAAAGSIIIYGTGGTLSTTRGQLQWDTGFAHALATPSVLGPSDTNFFIGAPTNRSIVLATNGGTAALTLAADQAATLAGKIASYNGVATAGWGVPAIQASARSVAQTAAVASVATYTVGAADGSFIVSANVLPTTSTDHAFTATCAYTDEGNTARTATLSFVLVAGGSLVTSVANANGAVPYMGVPLHIRCKTGTSITIATTGTFTTVTYNVEGLIKQVN